MSILIRTIATIKSQIDEATVVMPKKQADEALKALEKQIPKKVYHFLDDDTFDTTCCGLDITNQVYDYCPNCGQLLGDVEEVEESNG